MALDRALAAELWSTCMHVAITGASSGIGEAIARDYARVGAKLTLVARRVELLDKLAAEVGGAHVVPLDLSNVDRATAWLAGARAANGPIDVLVNNAGIENTGAFASSDPTLGVKVLNVNLVVPLLITRAVLPEMIERRCGAVVQVASMGGLAASLGHVWYGASKAGLANASETLRLELRDTGVHVVVVYPGPVTTAMVEAAFAAMGGREAVGKVPEGTPAELARRVRRAVDSGAPRVLYPSSYALTYWAPWLVRWLKARRVRLPGR
jgi:short-subunit dehydrogenase